MEDNQNQQQSINSQDMQPVINNQDTQPEPVPSETAQPKYVLVACNKAKNLETRYTLEEGREITVGADPRGGVFVEDDDFISYRHFSAKIENSAVIVQDIGSKNGLYRRIDNAEQISPGQSLLAGKTIFRLEEQRDEQF